MLPLFANAPPPNKSEPYGYRCNDCGHLWDAQSPLGRPLDAMAAMDHARVGHCPECGVIGTASTLRPEAYARLKAEQKVQTLGESAA